MSDVQEVPPKVKEYDILSPVSGPGYAVVIENSPRRVRVVFNGKAIADSVGMKLMHETGHIPVYYFPMADIRMDLLQKSDHTSHCPHKGDAAYWHVKVGDRVAENAMWSYESPFDTLADAKGLAAFYWSRMDHWYEEDEEVFVHARDPYKRVDTIASSRRVVVRLAGEVVADTVAARFLFETGLPTRYYIPKEDVRMDLLTPSELTTGCPYKGVAQYFSVTAGGEIFADVAWTYPEPIAECPKIRDLLCFYNEKAEILVG